MNFLRWIYARTIFYPTLGWNMLLGRWLKVRNWYDFITPEVIVGAFPFARDVPKMASDGVKAVVNTCEEYPGPVEAYSRYDIDQFRMPTVDFTHPEYEDVCRAVEFVQNHVDRGDVVYIHCKAGRARSATVAICWLMKSQQISAVEAQRWLLEKRPHINPRLTQRSVVQKFEKDFVNPNDAS
ncbi:MAG: dual specificity protein phosphatase family protein [Planctomycetota bacterium]